MEHLLKTTAAALATMATLATPVFADDVGGGRGGSTGSQSGENSGNASSDGNCGSDCSGGGDSTPDRNIYSCRLNPTNSQGVGSYDLLINGNTVQANIGTMPVYNRTSGNLVDTGFSISTYNSASDFIRNGLNNITNTCYRAICDEGFAPGDTSPFDNRHGFTCNVPEQPVVTPQPEQPSTTPRTQTPAPAPQPTAPRPRDSFEAGIAYPESCLDRGNVSLSADFHAEAFYKGTPEGFNVNRDVHNMEYFPNYTAWSIEQSEMAGVDGCDEGQVFIYTLDDDGPDYDTDVAAHCPFGNSGNAAEYWNRDENGQTAGSYSLWAVDALEALKNGEEIPSCPSIPESNCDEHTAGFEPLPSTAGQLTPEFVGLCLANEGVRTEILARESASSKQECKLTP